MYAFHISFALHLNLTNIVLAIVICILGYFLSFTYKMILGLFAFWSTDTGGVFNLSEMFLFLFAGYIIPLQLYPPILGDIARVLPFSLMIYYPIVAIQGSLDMYSGFKVILLQGVWCISLVLLYVYMWKQGLKQYTGVGQ
jgi:ABC-2 type transport system permease protein